jgi:uncharacterized protein involved in copper resistance
MNEKEKEMKMKKVMSMMMLLMLLVPGAALAMDHSKMDMDHGKKAMEHKAMDHGDMDHDKMEMVHDDMDNGKMDHGKMGMSGMDKAGMTMLDTEEVKGVKAMFHLYDVKSAMAKAGQSFSHHLMINFVDSKTGKAVEKGRVELKVTTPAGVEEKKQVLMGMAGGFGVDLILDQTGTYHFKLGTKLADGKKRMFHPHHEL